MRQALLVTAASVLVLLAWAVTDAGARDRVYKAPLSKLSDRQLEREAAHARFYLRFMRYHRIARFDRAFRHRTCFTVRKIRRGLCFYVRNRVRHREAWLAKVESLLVPPAPTYSLGGLNCMACWDRVASCESGGNWSISTGNGFYGGLQWLLSTWLAYGGGRYASNPVYATRMQQISIASHMSLSHWPVCGARY